MGKINRVLKKTFNSIGILIVLQYINNTIETNQSYQKFKEILTARHIISQWLSTAPVFLNCFKSPEDKVR